MHHLTPVKFLVCLLSTTALALLGPSSLAAVGPPWDVPVEEFTPDTAVVYAFYDALNTSLRTGHPPEFAGILAENVVAHIEPGGLPPTRAGVVAHVLALRAVFPSLQLRPQDIRATKGLVVADVHVDGATDGAFLGLPLARQLKPWIAGGIFRIAAGLIAEFWTGQAVGTTRWYS